MNNMNIYHVQTFIPNSMHKIAPVMFSSCHIQFEITLHLSYLQFKMVKFDKCWVVHPWILLLDIKHFYCDTIVKYDIATHSYR